MPRLLALRFALSLLLPISILAAADPVFVGPNPEGAGLPASADANLLDQRDARSDLALLKASFGPYTRGVIGLDWRGAVDGCGTAGSSSLNCASTGSCFGGQRTAAADRLGRASGLACSDADAAYVQFRQDRLPALLRLAVYTDGAMGWHRLDNSCRGNSADRCSMLAVVFGIHGASASMQWREDGARALIARREFAGDAVHLRFQLTYQFK